MILATSSLESISFVQLGNSSRPPTSHWLCFHGAVGGTCLMDQHCAMRSLQHPPVVLKVVARSKSQLHNVRIHHLAPAHSVFPYFRPRYKQRCLIPFTSIHNHSIHFVTAANFVFPPLRTGVQGPTNPTSDAVLLDVDRAAAECLLTFGKG